jgi:hypothetical protein
MSTEPKPLDRAAGVRLPAREPDRIRLGGRRVLSINALTASSMAIPEPGQQLRLDWGAVAARAGLNPAERKMFLAHWRDSVTAAALANRLKITAAAASRLRATVHAKLVLSGQAVADCVTAEPVPDSCRPAFRERLASGARPWALGRLDGTFVEIMGYEKYFHLLSQRHPNESQKSRVFCAGGIGAQMLTSDLKNEEARLARVAERLHAVRMSADACERELSVATGELADEMVRAVLEDRAPAGGALQKKIEKLQAALDQKRAEIDGAAAALVTQRGIVEGLQEEISRTRRQAFLAATLERRQRIRGLIDQLSAEMVAFHDAAQEYGQDRNSTLYPSGGADPIAGSSYRGAAVAICESALALSRHVWQKNAGSVLELVA